MVIMGVECGRASLDRDLHAPLLRLAPACDRAPFLPRSQALVKETPIADWSPTQFREWYTETTLRMLPPKKK
jgi:hypothetical protein